MIKKYGLITTIVGFGIAAGIGMLCFKWYNYLLFRPVLPFWQWYILAFIYIFCVINTALQKPFTFITSALFLSACTIQMVHWFGLVALPLIK